MGTPKALLRAPDGTSWVERAVRALRDGGCAEVTVVLGAELPRTAPLLTGLDARIVAAADWAEGLGASLRAGLGELLRSSDAPSVAVILVDLLARWGARGMARGAVVVIFSDGWERDGVDLLTEQMRRLQMLAHRIVWVNPHRGKDGYQAVQQGIVAALPFVDHFVAGHSLRTFEEVAEVVADA